MESDPIQQSDPGRRPSGGLVIGAAVILIGLGMLARQFEEYIPGFELARELARSAGWGLAFVAIGAALVISARRSGSGFRMPDAGTRLYRSRDGKMIAGVLGGIARHFGADPSLVRLLFVAFAFLADTGTAILAYIVCALLIPMEPEASPTAPSS